MDREFSDELTGLMPVMRHGIAGVDCSGRVVAVVEGNNVELRCDRCSAIVGVVQVGIMESLLGLDCAEVACPHCGNLSMFDDCDAPADWTCEHCDRQVGSPGRSHQ